MVNLITMIGVFGAVIIFSILFGEWSNIIPKRKNK